MPVRLGNGSIEIMYPDKTYTVETIKSTGERDGDTIVNVPVVPLPQVVSSVPSETIDASYKYMAFTHSGGSENQTEYSLLFNTETECEILIVGGGGGGSRWRAGGGGGDVLYFQGVDLSGTYNIKVGEGGAVPRDTSHVHKWGGYNGEISSITGGDSGKTLNINASGGAGAGGWSLDPLNPVTVLYTNPITGATETSSGGGAGTANTNHIPSTGNGVSGNGAQGDYDGWENSADDGAGGGGGGGGTNGNGGLPVGETGGTGGDGENIDITGTSIMYGRGGDGWGENNGTPIITPENIGQGGAGARNPEGIHRPGGSGIVIIRYKVTDATMEPKTLTYYTEERMYPPTRNLTSASHTISGEAYGNGVYVTTQSESYDGIRDGYSAFNTSMDSGPHFNSKYTSAGVYNSDKYVVDGYLGDWIKVKMPVKINLTKYGFKQRLVAGDFPNRAPGQYKIYGSNDDITWVELVHKTSTISYSSSEFKEYVTTTGEYSYFALVVNRLVGNDTVLNFDEWYIYGQEYLYEDPNYKTLTFTYDATDQIVYDFNDITDDTATGWNTFVTTNIPNSSTSLSNADSSGSWKYPGIGFIEFTLPSVYDKIDVTFTNSNSSTSSTNIVILKIGGVEKSRANRLETKTYSQTYTTGQVFRIEENDLGIIGKNLVITLSKTQNSYDLTFDNPTECDILIVAGGGGGGSPDGGGGGAGGLIFLQNQTVDSGTYTIKVGKGGLGGKYPDGNPGQKGYNSEILGNGINQIGIGGGGGGQGWPSDIEPTPSGGGSSGGLGSGDTNRETSNIHTTNQGNSGGLGDSSRGGGGGGGAGLSGNNGGSGTSNGLGGDGLEIDITGINIFYAGGGGGGHAPSDVDKAGGQGGGGLGKGRGDGNDGEPNTGGGGGGGGAGGGDGGNGGSGIVIIRYKTQYNQVPFNAQWTYSATDTSVHHYGNVGIGTTASDNTALTIKGDMNMIGNYYKNNVLLTEKWLSSSANTNNIYREKGFVGIGTYDVQYGIHVEGQIYASSGGITGDGSTTWSAPSDSRIKQNIVPASGKKCVENIRNINLYRFNYDSSFIDTDDRNQLGFIAQEVQQYYPKAVKRNSVVLKNNNKIDGLLSVDVTQINYTLYGAVKKLTEDIIAIKENLGITEIQKDVKNVAYVREDGEDSNGLIMS